MAEDFFDRAELLGLVVDDKIYLVAEAVDVDAKNADAKGVEGANGGAVGLFAVGGARGFGEELGNAFLHLARGFVGEGDGEDVAGADAAGDHVGNAKSDHTGLARAGAGEDEDGAANGLGGLPLFGIEGGEIDHEGAECRGA